MSAILDITKPKFRRDWSAYLVIADQHDDAGDEVTARRMRREGETMRTLVEAIVPACERSPYRTLILRGDLPCELKYECRVSKLEARLVVWLWVPSDLNPALLVRRLFARLHMSRQIIAEPTRQGYLPERIRRAIFVNTGFLFEQP